ncbi:MAG: response regulator [Helicobacteraceae bacterium]|nr:response regulator [Helicobacteraceae bacterium]
MAKIVIIDDEQEILTTLERFLTRNDLHKVQTFANPLTALERLNDDTEIILLDVMMPQINGLELLPKLKVKYPNAKVIIMTAYSTLETVLQSQRAGATDYIMKPFKSLDEITKKIKAVL